MNSTVADRISQSVVNIAYGTRRATGTVIAPGKVVTCFHAVRNKRAPENPMITVGYHGAIYHAQILHFRQRQDLCLLDVPGLPAAPIARAKAFPRIGDPVTAVGMQRGEACVARGDVTFCDGNDDAAILLSSAPVRPGYSGGPLCNAAGELVGINAKENGGALPLRWLESRNWERLPAVTDAYYHTLKAAQGAADGAVPLPLLSRAAKVCGYFDEAQKWERDIRSKQPPKRGHNIRFKAETRRTDRPL